MNMRESLIEVLRSGADERRALFSTAASDLETRAENIEKDLYVCWVLDFLFNRRTDDSIGLYFKGGTSLSKAYGLIQRFSEDIDIGIYKEDLKVPLEADIAALPSVNQQQKALAEQVDKAARQYMSGPLKDLLDKEIATVEGEIGQEGHFSLGFGYDSYRKTEALDVLVLGYKSVFDTSGGYVEAAVRIEGGARPDPLPTEKRQIVPYIASEMRVSIDLIIPNVTTVKPERKVPDLNRYSRHYYDVHQIWTHAEHGKATASLLDLAEACRKHKDLMFRAPDHRYDRAVPGSFHLIPTADMRKKLAVDYARMSAMIFGKPPEFEVVMSSILELERFLNDRAAI